MHYRIVNLLRKKLKIMATKTFEELKQMAIQIRDEKTNKQNTATRIGTQMLEHLTKLEQDFLDKDTTESKFSELGSGKILYCHLLDKTGNIISIPTQEIEGIYQVADGTTYTNVSSWGMTPIVPLNSAKRIRYHGHNTTTSMSVAPVVFFDINYKVIGAVTVGDLQPTEYDDFETDVPDNAVYARYCSHTYTDKFEISVVDFRIEKPTSSISAEIQKDNRILCSALINYNGKVSDLSSIENGAYIDKNGVLQSSNSYLVTDYVCVDKLKTITWQGYLTKNVAPVSAVAFYDYNKKFISSITVGADSTDATYKEEKSIIQDIVIPEYAVYARATCHFCAKTIHNIEFCISSDVRNIDIVVPEVVNPINYYRFFDVLFDKILFIGDSVTEGHVYDYPRTPVNGTIYHQYSYPAMFKKITGVEVENAGFSGISATGWFNNKRTLYDYKQYELVFIELGYNGSLSIDDIYTPGTNTYDYRQIISYVKTKNPKAYIILVISSAYDSSRANAVIEIARISNLQYIDLRQKKYDDLNKDAYHGYDEEEMTSRSYWHFNRIGYLAKARVVVNELNNLIYNNAENINNYIGVADIVE